MTYLGLDVGGANLKAATDGGWHASVAFPLWRQPHELRTALQALIDAAPRAERIVATMTGELADCFRTKREGVHCIVRALIEAARDVPLSIYLTDGRAAAPQVALEHPTLTAASNWHALAAFVGQHFQVKAGLLLDLGSTTCDIIPLAANKPAAAGHTDTQRLLAGELVYTGVVRSPVCALVGSLPYRGQSCPVAQELFATTLDAYLTLNGIPEDPQNLATADGRPATRENARDRLARCICADAEQFNDRDALQAAEAIQRAQCSLLRGALKQVVASMPTVPDMFVLSGQGEFLLRELAADLTAMPASTNIKSPARVFSLAETLGAELSRVAPAFALAKMAEELTQ